MTLASLWQLIRRDMVRVRGALMTSGFGIAAGTGALVFFLALGLGVRAVLLGEVFPIDQVELEPPKSEGGSLVGSLLFGGEAPGISEEQVERLRASEDVEAVFPKLRMAFPASAGGEIFGRKIGSSEMIADGVDPALVKGDVKGDIPFEDPLKKPGKACEKTSECDAPQYCEGPAGEKGVCVDPVPVLVSRYMVELYDTTIAPTHNLPPGEALLGLAQSIVFRLWLGQSLLGQSKRGSPRHAHARVVGISRAAIDIGITLPLDTVRRWNAEYAGEEAAAKYSSVLVKVKSNDKVGEVIALGAELGLSPKDTRARDVSVLLAGVMALLALVAAVILIVSASNIAYTFRVLVQDRQREIALYRAIGASAADMVKWLMSLALTVGLSGGALGLAVAYLLSLGADYLAASRLPDFPFKPESFFAFPWWLLLSGLAFAALFALLGAFGPARRAGKVDPAAALATL